MLRRAFSGLNPVIPRLAATHFTVDAYSNIYAPLLPLLIPHLGMSLAAAGALTMCFQLAASVSQLGFGQLADRWRPRLLLLVGPIASVLVLSAIGLAGSMWTLALVLVLGGLGGAAFHPPAAALVHKAAGRRQGFAMSLHITGGSIGFSLGPLLFAPVIERMGLAWSPVIALPGLLCLALTLPGLPRVDRDATHAASGGVSALRPYARVLTLLYLVVVLRTLAALSFATFVPVMLTRRGMSLSEAAGAVSFYLLASGVGGFVGGPLADRFGPRRVIATSLVCAVPFLVAAPILHGWAFVVVLAGGGFFLQSTLPVNVTFAQQLAPVSAATVSSLMMGFAWGTGGLTVPLVGMLADRVDIAPALMLMGLTPLAGAALAMLLPRDAGPTARRVEETTVRGV
jgi:FSR family fosmidomycin resistance protein-like MFS transporter